MLKSPSQRAVFYGLGTFFFVLGVLGYFLPVLPGTFPMICAAYCFGKADPRIERWLLNHRLFGPSLRRWRETGGMSLRAKVLAISMIVLSVGLSIGLTAMPLWVAGLVLVFAGGSIVYLATRPTVN